MAHTYWISFKISNEGPFRATYEGRYQALESAIAFSTKTVLWKETPSFIVFDTDSDEDAIVAEITKAIDASADLAVLCRIGSGAARSVGRFHDEDIFTLMPFLTAS